MPLQATSGAASYDAFGGGVPVVPNYIEDVFSTWLYAGTGANQTITNGIDESGKGAMTWIKCRTDATSHALYDTERGAGRFLTPNATSAQSTSGSSRGLSSFNSTGFSLDDDSFSGRTNQSGQNYASWTFRKAPKFFDVVTYTGTGSAANISHNLGSVPGCIIVKCTDQLTSWAVYHRSLGGTYLTRLNTTGASETGYENWANTNPTSTVFTVGNGNATNGSGFNYVAYVFAHNAGGFGLTGTDNVISCGSFVSGGTTTTNEINLGYEPQWVMIKPTTDNGSYTEWRMYDVMRGASETGAKILQANNSRVEATDDPILTATSTGFKIKFDGANMSGITFIYIAIRRGPMKVPTSGTSVFAPVSRSGTYTVTPITAGFAPDLIVAQASNLAYGAAWWDRLRGKFIQLRSYTTAAEMSSTDSVLSFDNTGVTVGLDGNEWINGVSSGNIYANWMFGRAPSFFDEVCYTGNGSTQNITHNLGVAPELMIVKMRSATSATGWIVYAAPLASAATSFLVLNLTDAVGTGNSVLWNSTAPTSTVFSLGASSNINTNGATNVAYLFATCAGVSKVGSYTGTATTKQIDCGFTGGARFVLIKRTDSTGDWYVWDTARGIVSGNDPYLLLNSTAAEVTNTDYIDTYSAGFEISSTAPSAINASGGTFIFLAIA
jgi:hypothetical protein